VLYLRETLADLSFSEHKASLLYIDNLACIVIRHSENLLRRNLSYQINIRQHFVCKLVLAGFSKLVPLCTYKIAADTLIKSQPSPAFIRYRQIMTCQVPFAAWLRGILLGAVFSYFPSLVYQIIFLLASLVASEANFELPLHLLRVFITMSRFFL